MSEPADTKELQTSPETSRDASSRVLERAWKRAAPVLQAAGGGSLFTASVALMGSIIKIAGSGVSAELPFSPVVNYGMPYSTLGLSAVMFGIAGVGVMREPVKKAYESFKSQPWKNR